MKPKFADIAEREFTVARVSAYVTLEKCIGEPISSFDSVPLWFTEEEKINWCEYMLVEYHTTKGRKDDYNEMSTVGFMKARDLAKILFPEGGGGECHH